MARAVHWLESELFSFTSNPKDVILIFEVMTADLPEFRVIYIGADHLIISPNSILTSHQLHQS